MSTVPRNILRLTRTLHSRIPILGNWLRARAIDQLFASQHPDALAVLLNAATDSGYAQTPTIIAKLSELKNQEQIDPVCAKWEKTRHPALERLIREQRWIASAPTDLRVRTALLHKAHDTLHKSPQDAGEIARCLTNCCQNEEGELGNAAADCLRSLKHPSAINALCEVWADTRAPTLGNIIRETGYLAQEPLSLRALVLVHRRLHIEQVSEENTPPNPALIPHFLTLCSDTDPEIAAFARQMLETLTSPALQNAVCMRFLRAEDKLGHRARDIACEQNYLPRDRYSRAIFHFLTEQWEAYEALDFDNSLLRTAYEFAADDLRQRMATTARQAGRIAWVEAITGRRRQRNLGEMTPNEWEIAVQVLTEGRRWEELWTLASEAPAPRSAPLIAFLAQQNFTPPPAQAAFFDELRKLSLRAKAAPLPDETFHLCHTVHAASGEIYCLALDTSTLAVGTSRWTTHVWSLPDVTPLATLEGEWDWSSINSIALTPDKIILGTWQGVWSYARTNPDTPLPFGKHSRPITNIALHPNCAVLASGSHDHSIQLWDVTTTDPTAQLRGHIAPIDHLAFHPTRPLLASGDDRGEVRLWNTKTQTCETILQEHQKLITALRFTQSGHLVTASRDQTIHIWRIPHESAANPELIRVLDDHTGAITDITLSPDERILATASADNDIRLWRMPEGRPLRTLIGHTNPVMELAFSPDGRFLASGDRSGNTRIWRTNGEPIQTLPAHPTMIVALRFTSDGEHLICASRDGMIRVHAITLGALLARAPASISPGDIARVREALRRDANPHPGDPDPRWLEYLLALLHARTRYDIELDDAVAAISIGEFDIEIEG